MALERSQSQRPGSNSGVSDLSKNFIPLEFLCVFPAPSVNPKKTPKPKQKRNLIALSYSILLDPCVYSGAAGCTQPSDSQNHK